MRKLVLIILIVVIVVMFTACQKSQEQPTFEQRVIEAACNKLDVDTNGAALTLVSSEYVTWLDCEANNYILTLADGSQWLVGQGRTQTDFIVMWRPNYEMY